MVRLINNEEVAQLVCMQEVVDAMEVAYRAYGQEKADMFGRRDLLTPLPELDVVHGFKVMGGVVPELDSAAIRIDSDLLSWPKIDGVARRVKMTAAQDSRVRIGKENGIVLVYSIRSGEILSIMTDGEIQRLRVGATSALAAKYLSRSDSKRVGLLGSGYQAETQLRALACVRPITEVMVYSPNRAHRIEFAENMSKLLNISVEPCETPEQTTVDIDILASATNSLGPTISSEWLCPGMHINSIKKEEVDTSVLNRCSVIITGNKIISKSKTIANKKNSKAFQADKKWWTRPDYRWENYDDLSNVVAGKHPGRDSADQITCYVGSSNSIQFAALGMLIYQKAEKQDMGLELPSERFLQAVYQR